MKNLNMLGQIRKQEEGFTMTGLLVTCSLIAIIAPVIGSLMVELSKTQAKALNFGEAESKATLYSTIARTNKELHEVPNECELEDLGNEAYTIECTVGHVLGTIGRATRTFDIYVESNNENETNEPTVKEGPYTPGVYCPEWDPDGTLGYDNDHNVNCNPNGWWNN